MRLPSKGLGNRNRWFKRRRRFFLDTKRLTQNKIYYHRGMADRVYTKGCLQVDVANRETICPI